MADERAVRRRLRRAPHLRPSSASESVVRAWDWCGTRRVHLQFLALRLRGPCFEAVHPRRSASPRTATGPRRPHSSTPRGVANPGPSRNRQDRGMSTSPKRLARILTPPPSHWVGDGFPVRSLFSYAREAERWSPFMLLDYMGPMEFEPTNDRRGVGPHPHRGFETVTVAIRRRGRASRFVGQSGGNSARATCNG